MITFFFLTPVKECMKLTIMEQPKTSELQFILDFILLYQMVLSTFWFFEIIFLKTLFIYIYIYIYIYTYG